LEKEEQEKQRKAEEAREQEEEKKRQEEEEEKQRQIEEEKNKEKEEKKQKQAEEKKRKEEQRKRQQEEKRKQKEELAAQKKKQQEEEEAAKNDSADSDKENSHSVSSQSSSSQEEFVPKSTGKSSKPSAGTPSRVSGRRQTRICEVCKESANDKDSAMSMVLCCICECYFHAREGQNCARLHSVKRALSADQYTCFRCKENEGTVTPTTPMKSTTPSKTQTKKNTKQTPQKGIVQDQQDLQDVLESFSSLKARAVYRDK